MSLMDDILEADAAAFVNADEFGESVNYMPVTGDPREVSAGVERNPPMMVMNLPNTNAPMFLVLVANNAITGISAEEINRGSDRIGIKIHKGDAEYAEFRITVIEKEDAGMILLQVR
jgi:hypothetical protein